WKVPYDSDLVVHMQSRPFLESIVRERLARLGNVTFRYQKAVGGLEVEDGRAAAVRVRDTEGEGAGEAVAADLIVDATGRGSSLVRLLAAHGYPAPPEERLALDIQYASRLYRPRPDAARTWKAMLLYQKPPAARRLGLIFPVEDGRWIVTLGGYLGEHPTAGEDGFLDFARSLEQPDLFAAIRDAEPLSEIQTIRFPAARWTRFDRMRGFPRGLLPVGDTVCSFDPVFGQGMSVAARGARLLAAHLARDPWAENPRPYLRALARVVAAPWLLTSSEDLRYEGVEGRRPLWLPWLQRYTRRVFKLTGTSVPDYDRLLRVLHLLAPPPLLFHPATLARVVFAR
ncbi:MAG TPA: 2-polyprenyl-6-methoxyphenol hydroxylase-like oxidoreductase, partial [Thermoanaerobaculia bacterium]|nr:2-polyprenyl-6-methoxyphenol hydroxylase-like oxidoreductase [Thermoanaerobaculia bacterium]